MKDINKIDLIREIEQEFFSRINTKNSWGKDQVRIQWNESVIKVYGDFIKSNKNPNNSLININNTSYQKVAGRPEQGDKYIIIVKGVISHVKTFDQRDMECIEDRNSGYSVRIKEI